MKNLKFFEKIVFFFNSIAAFMLLLSYVLPLIPPKQFALLSVLSLGVPFLILLNSLFVLYWLVKLKKQLILSVFILVIGYFLFGSLYKFYQTEDIEKTNSFSVMNYNVRLFNLYNWIEDEGIEAKITEFISTEAPDILCVQEFHPNKNVDFSSFKYQYKKLSGKKIKNGQVIYSQFPIINSGSVEFPNTSNNAIYADVVKGKDTLRIYNVHLQSLHINTDVEKLKNENSERLMKGIGKTFTMQQLQVELFLEHKKKCPYKVIVSGDFNNTAFSYVYKQIKGDLNDAFNEAGNGFGRTYDFKFFPTRIDFIFSDPSFAVNGFKTYNKKYSDHYPIKAMFNMD